MKKFFYFSVALLSFLLISCGDKDKEVLLPDKILLTHEQYFSLAKAAAKAEVEDEFRKKAAKADALELLISEGWRPADCCSEKKLEQFDNFSDYGNPKKYQRFPQGSYDAYPKSTLASEEKLEEKEDEYLGQPMQPSSPSFPYITNAPVFNNYCCGGKEGDKEEMKPDKILSQRDSKIDELKKDTLIKKVLPWEIELGGGFSRGPVGSFRFGNSRAEAGGLFLWNRKEKTANSMIDVVVKFENNFFSDLLESLNFQKFYFRGGLVYQNKVSPTKWDIPNQKTTTVSAGGVTTVLNSTSQINVEHWNITRQAVGSVLGAEAVYDEKFKFYFDMIPVIALQKQEEDPIFKFNFRLGGNYFLNQKTLLGLNFGLINDKVYPNLSVRFIPDLEKTTDNNN
jgi:hypothetical protein